MTPQPNSPSPFKMNSHFFMISFLPALAYWYLDEYYPLKVAIIGGLSLAVLEIILEKIFTRHLHSLSIFNFFLMVILGLLSLLGDKGVWFKLQPFFTGFFMGILLLIYDWRGKGLMKEMVQGLNRPMPPPEVWAAIDRHLAIFLLIYSTFMGGLAIWGTSNQWIFFKTLGFYACFFVFMVAESLIMRKKMKVYLAKMGVVGTGGRPDGGPDLRF